MNAPIVVEIVGAPVAGCDGAVTEAWREAATWLGEQMHRRFGEAVVVRYYDVLDPGCPALPAGAQLPLVRVAGEVLSSGGKLDGPAIRWRVEQVGARAPPPAPSPQGRGGT